MNKTISKVITIGLIFSSMFSISGCEGRKSDEEFRKEKIAQIIESLDSRDPNKIKSLFAPNAIAEIPNLDESIAELINYYKGEHVSDRWKGLTVSDSFEKGDVTKDITFSFDITTTEDIFRVAIIKYRAEDTVNKKNVGLWQLFIIRFDDDPNSAGGNSYWGGLIYEPGLFIGTYRIIEEPTEEVGIYE